MKLSRICAIALAAGFFAGSAQASPKKEPAATSHGGAAESGEQVAAKTEEAAAESKGGEEKSLWGYGGKKGPAYWGRLSKKYAACSAGMAQSPVNIGGAGFDGASVEPIDFDYSLSPVSFLNNGHTVEIEYAPGSGMTVAGKRYELLQFHFHAPSEHAVNGKRAAAEMHLVHKSASGELAVVGVLLEEGANNVALSEFWGFMPRKAGQVKRDKKVLINARDLLPRDTGYYRYMGSLTTPPCSEGVNWYVMAEPVTIGARQLERFVTTIGANARPLQPVNERLVLAPDAGE